MLATLHTSDAPQSIDRLVDIFPADQQPQIVTQLSGVLEGIVSQRLLPRADGEGRVLAVEVLRPSYAIRNCIGDRKIEQVVGLMEISSKEGNRTIDGGLGIKEKYFAVDEEPEEGPPIRERLIRNCLRANYENFLKLGYATDFHTLGVMKNGELPPVRTGPSAGSRAEIGTIIDPSLSPGIDRVIANLEIRPPKNPGTPMTDVEVATAKKLAKDLSDAGVIEGEAAMRIIDSLTPKDPENPPKK